MILVGDLGGTHTRLALATPGSRALDRITRFANCEHRDFASVLDSYLGTETAIEAACIAVAGPTDGRRVQFTNLDWQIDADRIAARFSIPSVRLINDFAAVGWSLNALVAADLTVLQPGRPRDRAPRLALGAGTGLGVSLCVWQEGLYRPLPSEGGHIGFAPADAVQDRLLAFLRQRYGRVSVERMLCGAGIVELYAFCRSEAGLDPKHALEPKGISEAALAGTDAGAVAALELFAVILGQVAGDLALIAQAEGGVYIAGGIAPQVLSILRGGGVLRGFHAKGRYRQWMSDVPVAVVTQPDVGLMGAAIAA